MLGVEKLLKKSLAAEDRLRIAEEAGSDLPLFLIGGTVLGVGRGEQVYPLPELPPIYVVVATPDIGVSTPRAFADWDKLFHVEQSATSGERSGNSARAASAALTISGQTSKLTMFSREVYAWLNGSFSPVVSGVSARGGNRAEAPLLDLVRTGIENDFEQVVFTQFPELRDIKRALERAGSKYASLSGSGSTLYGLFATKADAEKAAAVLIELGIPAVATEFLSRKDYWKEVSSF